MASLSEIHEHLKIDIYQRNKWGQYGTEYSR
jgi:hypothetical protein